MRSRTFTYLDTTYTLRRIRTPDSGTAGTPPLWIVSPEKGRGMTYTITYDAGQELFFVYSGPHAVLHMNPGVGGFAERALTTAFTAVVNECGVRRPEVVA